MVIIQRNTVMVFSLHPYVFNSLRGRHAWNSFHFLRCRRSAYCCKFSHNDYQSQNNYRSYQRSWSTFQVGITAGVTFALTVFAFQTKIDFTACGGCRHYHITICYIAYIPCSFQHYSPPAEVVVINILVVLNISTFLPLSLMSFSKL